MGNYLAKDLIKMQIVLDMFFVINHKVTMPSQTMHKELVYEAEDIHLCWHSCVT